MDPDKLEEFKQRMKIPLPLPRLFSPEFPQQEAFYRDPAKLKALFCTRRAAKSYTAGLCLVDTAQTYEGSNGLFIGLTRASAKAIVWKDILHVIDRRFNLGASFNQTDLIMRLPNRSEIVVTGVDVDEEEMLKLLGRKWHFVAIDEGSMYTINTRNLVYGILKPACADFRAPIALFGTSSNFTRGLFYDITTGKEPGWSVHRWTAHDNPFVAKNWQEELDEIARERPLYMETPQYRQWYLNEWVVDEEKLVYRFHESRNLYAQLPHLSTDGWTYVLGVDTGWEDDNAFVLCGYHLNDPHLYVIRTFNKPKMTFDMVVEKIQEFMADSEFPPSKVIIDGANKQGVESMRARSNIPFEYADKQGKVDFIEMLNADLIQGKIKLSKECKSLMDEMMALVWKTEGDIIIVPKKEHPALPNHLCDAFLYAWRCGWHFQHSKVEEKIVVGSNRWYQKQAEDIWTREREKLMELENGEWPSEPGWGRL